MSHHRNIFQFMRHYTQWDKLLYASIIPIRHIVMVCYWSHWIMQDFLYIQSCIYRMLQKKHKKKHEILAFINPYYKRSNWKTWLSERFSSEALTSKLWNKKSTCCWSLQKWGKIELYSPPSPYGFIKNLGQIHLRDSQVKFMGKNKAKLCGLIGQNWQNSFQ